MSKISWSLRRRCTICTYTHTANLQTTNTNYIYIYSYIAVQLLPVYLSRNYRVIYVKMPKYNIGVCTDLLHIHREPPILHFYVYTIYYAQGRPSRGFQGGTCTPAFLPSPGNSYIIVHAFYFPRNSPPRAPLLSRPDGRPCIYIWFWTFPLRYLCSWEFQYFSVLLYTIFIQLCLVGPQFQKKE